MIDKTRTLTTLGAAMVLVLAGAGQAAAQGHPVGSPPDVLMAGARLLPGQRLTSPNGLYTFRVQTDGNLVVYFNVSPIWASQTYGNPAIRDLTMRPDGNLVLTRGA